MEIYKELNNPQAKEFEQLLNNQLSKIQIEEGKIINGKINKITEKFVFLFIEGLKSEPVLDINELKTMGLAEKIKIGETIPVLLEKIEDRNGEVLVSANKAQKIKGWDKLVEAYEKKEPVMGRITSKCKGGCIVEHIDTGSLMFLPGSQISDKPLKDISVAVENVGKLEVYKLEKGMPILATISGAAPMLGFLGTVTGMIRTFNQMQDSGQQITADLLSGGIGEAMMTTVAGLIVGIFAYIGYNLLSSMINKVVYKMEATSVEFLDILHEPA